MPRYHGFRHNYRILNSTCRKEAWIARASCDSLRPAEYTLRAARADLEGAGKRGRTKVKASYHGRGEGDICAACCWRSVRDVQSLDFDCRLLSSRCSYHFPSFFINSLVAYRHSPTDHCGQFDGTSQTQRYLPP